MTRVCPLMALIVAGPLIAQQPVMRVRPLGPIVAESRLTFASPMQARQLSDGRVMVNDGRSRVVVVLDSTLAHAVVVMDSVPGKANSYGTLAGKLMPFVGDSSLFLDATAGSFVVLDGSPRPVRVMALPPQTRAQEINTLVYLGGGIDGAGRFVYRISGRPDLTRFRPGQEARPIPPPDTALIARFDFGSRRVDTVGAFRVSFGYLPGFFTQDAFPVEDGWAITSDGRIAIVRAQDFHVDWIGAAGQRTTTPRVAHEWRQLTDGDRRRLSDSITHARDSATFVRLATLALGSTVTWDDLGNAVAVSGPASAVAPPNGPSGRGAPPPSPTPRPAVRPYPVETIPDYLVPFGTNAVRADTDGRLWIEVRLPSPPPGGPVFDVVDGAGILVDRVQIPEGRAVLGFGLGGIVYLTRRDAGRAIIEKARLR